MNDIMSIEEKGDERKAATRDKGETMREREQEVVRENESKREWADIRHPRKNMHAWKLMLVHYDTGARYAGGSWTASTLMSGVQVIDRLIRASSRMWGLITAPHVLIAGTDGTGSHTARDIAATVSCVSATHCPIEVVEARMSLCKKSRVQLAKLLEQPGIKQLTPEWFAARAELTTASSVADAIGRNGPTKAFLVSKVGEAAPFPVNAPPLKWGTMFEPIARAIYANRLGVIVHDLGLLRHPDIDYIGASPDGVSDMGVMLEIKCPYTRGIDGTVPAAYMAQIQCQLDVCGLDECDFLQCQFVEEQVVVEEPADDRPETASPMTCACLSLDGLERGIIVEYWDASALTYVYHYSPEIGTDQEGWAATTVQDLGPDVICKIMRWRLKGLDIVRVHRDAAYIVAMNHSIGLSWQQVLRYRGDLVAFKTEVLDVGRKRKKAESGVSN